MSSLSPLLYVPTPTRSSFLNELRLGSFSPLMLTPSSSSRESLSPLTPLSFDSPFTSDSSSAESTPPFTSDSSSHEATLLSRRSRYLNSLYTEIFRVQDPQTPREPELPLPAPSSAEYLSRLRAEGARTPQPEEEAERMNRIVQNGIRTAQPTNYQTNWNRRRVERFLPY